MSKDKYPSIFSPQMETIVFNNGAQPKAGSGLKMQMVSVVFSALHC